jgi:hypothetical protein
MPGETDEADVLAGVSPSDWLSESVSYPWMNLSYQLTARFPFR